MAVSRTHQRLENLRKHWLKEEERKRHARETYHLTNVPIIQQAAHEPSHHTNQEEEGREHCTCNVHVVKVKMLGLCKGHCGLSKKKISILVMMG